MDANRNRIETALTDEQGEIRGHRFGFKPDERGRPGDVYRLKARVANMSEWVESGEWYYLRVYDKRLLDIARTYCNNEGIADWTGRGMHVPISGHVTRYQLSLDHTQTPIPTGRLRPGTW